MFYSLDSMGRDCAKTLLIHSVDYDELKLDITKKYKEN